MTFDFLKMLVKILHEDGASGAELTLIKSVWQELELDNKSIREQADGLKRVDTFSRKDIIL